jgi:hypothetical protein
MYGEVYTDFGWKSEERDHLEDPDADERIILRRIFKKWNVELWTGLVWLRTGGGHL